MDKSISVDITPDKSLIQKLGLVGYRTVQAIAELVDNSIDARVKDQLEKINVHLDFEKKWIGVKDDGIGMDKNDLTNAMTIAKGVKSEGSLGQFGMGLKSACSALGKKFVIITSKKDSNKEYKTEYNEDTWLSDNSLNWKNFNITEKILSAEENWHGTRIVISELKVPLYPTQITKFKENFGIRYAPYLESEQVLIKINTVFCKSKSEDMEDESKIDIEIPLPSGIIVKGHMALLKKRSIQGRYGIHLIKNDRLIKAFEKFGFPAHPENAKIIGELNLDHVPVNFYKSEFIEESKEYQEVLKAFKISEALKQIRSSSQSKGTITASVESVFNYFGKKSQSQYLEHNVRAKIAQDLLNNTKPFEIKLGKNTAEIVIKSLKNGPLYTIENSDSKITVLINKDDNAFKFVKNPLFLIGIIASEIKLISDNPNFKKSIQERNSELKEFLEKWSNKSDTKEVFRDREIQIPNIANYKLADELIDVHDYLKENFELKFQFTALSTLASYLHNLHRKIIYTIYTTPKNGEYLAELLADKFHKKFTVINAPDRKALGIFLKMPTTDRIIVIREYAVIQGSTIATPEKAFLDLVNEIYSHDSLLDKLELKRIFTTMQRHELINYKVLRTYAKFIKKLDLLEKILGDILQW